MKTVYQEIKDSIPDAETLLLDDSIKIIFPDNIMFNTDESEILEHFLIKLRSFTSIFNKYNKTNLLITGHTDNTGQKDYNIKLSQARAENVKQKMIDLRAAKERIFTWGLGEKSPIAQNNTDEGRARNRRVEFVILFNSK